jgi:ubiquitin carboxyl-terminal hydrolase L3
VVHSVCNNLKQIEFEPSSPLLEFGRRNQGLDAEKLADQLQNADRLHTATGTVASMGQTATPDAEDEVNHHFITFIRSSAGHLLELDGMKPGPVDHGSCSAEELFQKAVGIIRDGMMTKTSDLTFSALGLTLAPEED